MLFLLDHDSSQNKYCLTATESKCLWVCIIPPSFLTDGWNENSPMLMCADVSASLQEEVVNQSFYALTH